MLPLPQLWRWDAIAIARNDYQKKDAKIMTTNPKEIPETVLHPLLLMMAEKFLEIYPDMSFEELVIRCMAKSVEDILPHDREVLEQIHNNPQAAIAQIKAQLEQNL
jgi:hypothetical protein